MKKKIDTECSEDCAEAKRLSYAAKSNSIKSYQNTNTNLATKMLISLAVCVPIVLFLSTL